MRRHRKLFIAAAVIVTCSAAIVAAYAAHEREQVLTLPIGDPEPVRNRRDPLTVLVLAVDPRQPESGRVRQAAVVRLTPRSGEAHIVPLAASVAQSFEDGGYRAVVRSARSAARLPINHVIALSLRRLSLRYPRLHDHARLIELRRALTQIAQAGEIDTGLNRLRASLVYTDLRCCDDYIELARTVRDSGRVTIDRAK